MTILHPTLVQEGGQTEYAIKTNYHRSAPAMSPACTLTKRISTKTNKSQRVVLEPTKTCLGKAITCPTPATQDEKLRQAGYTRVEGAPAPLPLQVPTFSVRELRAVIPKHCFERSLLTSSYHLGKNVLICGVLFAIASIFDGYEAVVLIQLIFWPVYWFLQTNYLAGLWVLGHECGHHAFSNYQWLDDLVGLVLHSSLLTPYHSWQISHRHHHTNIGSMEHDEVFIPMTKSEYSSWRDAVEDALDEAPIVNFFWLVVTLLVGWMPGYLVFNATGPRKYKHQSKSHFNPYAALFSDRERHLIMISDLGVGVAVLVLAVVTANVGIAAMTRFFVVPYMWLNGSLVFVTILQHTDTFVPRFREPAWTWLHGALTTVDRDYGWFLNDAWHHIADTHVAHHLFARMPFYHAQEATRALRPVLGEYYLCDDTPVWHAFWRVFTTCKFVDDQEPIVFCQQALGPQRTEE